MSVKLTAEQGARAIITTRLINAPRALVFEAWTKPEHLTKWFGPDGFSTTTSVFDMRPGGAWRFIMHGPDGRDYINQINYGEVSPPDFIRYHHGGGGDTENVKFSTLVTFEEEGGKTRITLAAEFPSVEERDRVIREYGAAEGAVQTLGRLAELTEAWAREKAKSKEGRA